MLTQLHFKTALLANGWNDNVSIEIDAKGCVADIRVKPLSSSGNQVNYDSGCLVPGMSNLHSHAHQRAMAGLAERSGTSKDSFWTWRKTMYQFLEKMTPEQLGAIASQLYLEMLCAGYTRVAEFQYLHHQADGSAYEDSSEMSKRCIEAAISVGLGMTCLPVHYQYAGFGEQPLADEQRRFLNDANGLLEIIDSLQSDYLKNELVNIGVAAHSLRASSQSSLEQIFAAGVLSGVAPIHIHVAEQMSEVVDCIAWCGARPVEYLRDNFAVDHNWCLIHATHLTPAETAWLAASGAVAGLCPTTEANLGDGFFNARPYLDQGGRIGIGSDSHVSISVTEELRWLEYGQRLRSGARNHLAGGENSSTGRRLFELAAIGGSQACGSNAGIIEIGRRADFVVLDTGHPLLACRQGDEILDSWIFSGNQSLVKDVYVAGRKVIDGGRHANQAQINANFVRTLEQII